MLVFLVERAKRFRRRTLLLHHFFGDSFPFRFKLALIVLGQESNDKTYGDQRVGEILGCFLVRELGGFPLAVVRAAMDDLHLVFLHGLA